MIFTKGEMIELKNGKRYLILDSAIIDNNNYFKIKEINDESDALLGEYKYISAIKKEDKIFIDDSLKEDIILKLKVLLES